MAKPLLFVLGFLLGCVVVTQSGCAAKPLVRPIVDIINDLCNADIICEQQVQMARAGATVRALLKDIGDSDAGTE